MCTKNWVDDVYNKLNQTNIEAKKLEEELDEVIENNEALESNVDQLKREVSRLKKVNEQLETEKNESDSATKREHRETIELQTYVISNTYVKMKRAPRNHWEI